MEHQYIKRFAFKQIDFYVNANLPRTKCVNNIEI